MTIELLAPAGNLEKLKIALAYGADAVYIAGKEFGLRSAADNFTLDEITLAVKFVRNKNKKLYLALNALAHDGELKKLPGFIKNIRELPPDGLICSDLGVMRILRDHTDIPLHVSTQASVLNHRHALIYKNMGARRIVVGRETGIREAGMIARETGLEIEMFVHGALCMSYSGNCVISNYVAGRDSNRGGCIQNCRYAYHAENMADPLYLMSSKDLNGLGHLKEFIQNKITSLKIEGRMKSSLYIATTVRAYANAVKRILKDPGSSLSDLEEELTKIPHRDYTEGSLMKPATKSSVYDHLDELNPGYEMAGTVIEIDRENNRFLMQAKNKIVSGETLEILTYNCADISLETKKMDNVLEKPIEIIHPQGLAWFPLQNGIDSPMVVRKKTIP